MTIIIFGPPFTRKGTQSKRMLNDFNLTHLSTGAVLRAEKVTKTALGVDASAFSN
ncbi:nucleoside monophosphate kinase [Cellulophaga sp. L1A9]|uniref:nucleoside monophosphate kinase n=1 Tax=Cellulophaga sp. L1A9 TaxID=2686362 RepID=UPI00131E1BC0|nr:nucleoside monophosphate kinase [Cellulophaga sp. L1A9]